MVLFADHHGRSPVIYALTDILDKVHVKLVYLNFVIKRMCAQ